MSAVTKLIMNAIRAGAPSKVVEFLGDYYERILDIDRNLLNKTLKPDDVKKELTEIEERLKRIRLYKTSVPFTIRERILACRLILQKALEDLANPDRWKKTAS